MKPPWSFGSQRTVKKSPRTVKEILHFVQNDIQEVFPGEIQSYAEPTPVGDRHCTPWWNAGRPWETVPTYSTFKGPDFQGPNYV
ncbi:MAG: hypothetical protein ACK41Q_02350 [Candidatus Brocadia sp.]